MSELTRIRMFLASPGDVSAERDNVSTVVNELNLFLTTLAPERAAVLELLRWETHAYPAAGEPQPAITQQIGPYDIFVGIMWKRFGTPTSSAGSGTEEEFNIAQKRWEKDGAAPRILFYFCDDAPDVRSKEDADQLAKVWNFRTEISKNHLIWTYPNSDAFAGILRPQLVRVLADMLKPANRPLEVAERVGELALRGPLSNSRTKASELAEEYEGIRELAEEYEGIRDSMSAGDARTRKMELVMTRMRTLAPTIFPLVRELSSSRSPGERLLAIAILQATPDPQYFEWLAGRIGAEKPFVEYHAGMALLAAAHQVAPEDRGRLNLALRRAQQVLGREKQATDRGRTIQAALDALGKTRR